MSMNIERAAELLGLTNPQNVDAERAEELKYIVQGIEMRLKIQAPLRYKVAARVYADYCNWKAMTKSS